MINERYQSIAVSASTSLQKGQSSVLGRIFCSTSSTGIIAIYDGFDTNGIKKVDNFTLVAGTSYPMNIFMKEGIYVQLVSGTAAFSIMWDA